MEQPPVKLGSMLFTMVDPHRGHEVAYNRWYERDHFYAGCMIFPGLFAGRRWVAPRRLKELRLPAGGGFVEPLDAGSYLSIYWWHQDRDHFVAGWDGPSVFWLYQNGRGFDERSHAHTAHYSYVGTSYRDSDGVPVELALHHDYRGLGVVVIEPADEVSPADLLAWLEGAAPGWASISSWTLSPAFRPENRQATASPMSLGSDGGDPDRVLQLVFCERDPEVCWDGIRRYTARIDQGGRGRVSFAAPFLPTVVGTDTYTDELW
jgi:hypothetical protein